MPNVNGYELARFMRGKSELQMVPVLLLAGAFENVDEASLASSGANGILEKPVEPTTLINRVKELLGLKSEEKPVPTGRLVTPGMAPADRNRPSAAPVTSARPHSASAPPGMPATEDQPRKKSGLDSEPRPMADSASQSADYLDTLDAAFDSLDQQLSGRLPVTKTPRSHAGPVGQGAANPVFEVDDEWFNAAETQARADARAGDHEIAEDLRAPEFRSPVDPTPMSPIFEVDDEWFAEGNKTRARKALEQEQLANEMGVHEVEFPVAAKPHAPASTIAPIPPAPIAPIDPLPRVVGEFQALLASGLGERQQAPPPEIKLVAPEITDEMLDQIASRVGDRLTAGAFGESLKEAMAATMRETVRAVVTETSERVIRDTASSVVAETSERIVRDTVHTVVAETSERVVRESVQAVVAQASERVLRDTVPPSWQGHPSA